ncbi:unnamed protein product [Chironomus riparius]|uniref:Chromo domain-containing protein n=1 Tax=Chironomus riparius TaxID=315576 RepID=A0A9N9RWZ8_9DIPT|nr:unnamed protein product [Chironomus riparius]
MKAIGLIKFDWWGLDGDEEKYNYITKVEIEIIEAGFKKSKQVFSYPSLNLLKDELIDGEICTSVSKDAKQRIVSNFEIHEGKEFYSNWFNENVLKPYNIHHYSTKTDKKSCLSEIYIKHLKVLIYKYMDLHGTNTWYDALESLTEKLNNRKHSRYGFIPNKVTRADEKRLLKMYNKPFQKAKNIRYKVNDQVRIQVAPKLFRRAFHPYWSSELYTIKAVNIKDPVMYTLSSFDGKILPRRFYQEELQKTKVKDHWLVEKIIKTSGNKVLVRYFGFGKEYDEWIDKADLYDAEKK